VHPEWRLLVLSAREFVTPRWLGAASRSGFWDQAARQAMKILEGRMFDGHGRAGGGHVVGSMFIASTSSGSQINAERRFAGRGYKGSKFEALLRAVRSGLAVSRTPAAGDGRDLVVWAGGGMFSAATTAAVVTASTAAAAAAAAAAVREEGGAGGGEPMYQIRTAEAIS
ncbi:unnamed protein product, partial [Pylaiella littoralis]